MSLGLITAFIADYLSTYGALGANTIAASGEMALQRLFRKRAETGRDILIEEMKLGKRTTLDLAEEDAAAVTFRYMRASVEGTARLNLGLMQPSHQVKQKAPASMPTSSFVGLTAWPA